MSYSRRIRAVLMPLVAAGLFLSMGATASAVSKSFGTTSTPLSVSAYGSVAKSYGSWSINDQSFEATFTQLVAHYKYTDADNHKVFTAVSVSGTQRQGGAKFSAYLETTHVNIVSSSWTAYPTSPWTNISTPSAGTADAVGTAKVCLDIPWRTDPCTSKQLTTSF